MTRRGWRTRAACRGLAWLMDPPPEVAPHTERAAVSFCHRRCPVVPECLLWALRLDAGSDPGGVTGGTTEEQRSELREELRAIERAQAARARGTRAVAHA